MLIYDSPVDFLTKIIDNVNIMIDLNDVLLFIALFALFYLINQYVYTYGFKTGVVAGIEKALDELVKEGLIYYDEREEIKRKKRS